MPNNRRKKMQFQRMTKEDIENLSGVQLKPGTCSFVIKKAEEVISKSSGNLQMQVEMEVTDSDGKMGPVTDFIFYSEKAQWKMVSFCKAINGEEFLLEGNLEAKDLINKRGQLVIIHEEYKGEKRNKVQRYLPFLDKVMEQVAKSEEPFFDDTLPF